VPIRQGRHYFEARLAQQRHSVRVSPQETPEVRRQFFYGRECILSQLPVFLTGNVVAEVKLIQGFDIADSFINFFRLQPGAGVLLHSGGGRVR